MLNYGTMAPKGSGPEVMLTRYRGRSLAGKGRCESHTLCANSILTSSLSKKKKKKKNGLTPPTAMFLYCVAAWFEFNIFNMAARGQPLARGETMGSWIMSTTILGEKRT